MFLVFFWVVREFNLRLFRVGAVHYSLWYFNVDNFVKFLYTCEYGVTQRLFEIFAKLINYLFARKFV